MDAADTHRPGQAALMRSAALTRRAALTRSAALTRWAAPTRWAARAAAAGVAGILALSVGAAPASAQSAAPAVGDAAPDFTLKDQDGKDVTLSAFRGKSAVVIAFYPRDFTPGCTRQNKCFSREVRKIEDRGAALLAVSSDPVEKHKDFAAAIGARYPMLADVKNAVSKAYGVFVPSPEGGYAARSTFLVDKEGKLRWIERDTPVPATLEGSRLLAEIEKLGGLPDPAAPLAGLPSPEREVRTAVVRWLHAFLREDAAAVRASLHPNFGTKAGEPPFVGDARRDAELDRERKLFEAADLRALAFADVLDPLAGRIVSAAAVAKDRTALGPFTDASRRRGAGLSADPAHADHLVEIPVKLRKTGAVEFLPAHLCAVVRKDGDAWRVLDVW